MSNEPQRCLLHPTPTPGLQLLTGNIISIICAAWLLLILQLAHFSVALLPPIHSNNSQFFLLITGKCGDLKSLSLQSSSCCFCTRKETISTTYHRAELLMRVSHDCSLKSLLSRGAKLFQRLSGKVRCLCRGRETVNLKVSAWVFLCNAELLPSDLFSHASLPTELYLTLLKVIYPAEIPSAGLFFSTKCPASHSHSFTHLHLV